MEKYQEAAKLPLPSRLEVFSRSKDSPTTLRQAVVNLNQDVDLMARRISDLFDRAMHVKVIARDANRTFLQIRDCLDGHKVDLDKVIPIGKIASKESRNVAKSVEDEELPTVLNFQAVHQSLSRLQKLTEEWVSTYDTGFPVPQNISSSIHYDFDITLGDKQHPKSFLRSIKQIQWRVYKLTPSWARSIVHSDKSTREQAKQEDNLDGLESLCLDIDINGLRGHDVLEDRNMVNGMLCLQQHIAENESRAEIEDNLEGAFAFLEQ